MLSEGSLPATQPDNFKWVKATFSPWQLYIRTFFTIYVESSHLNKVLVFQTGSTTTDYEGLDILQGISIARTMIYFERLNKKIMRS